MTAFGNNLLGAVILLFWLSACSQVHHLTPCFTGKEVTIDGVEYKLNRKIKANQELIPYFFSNSDDFPELLKADKDFNGVLQHGGLYKPTFIFQSGMNAYRYYKSTGDQVAREYFLAQIKWLKDNFHVYDQKYGFWLFMHPKKSYNLSADWPSALSQGMGMGLSLMAYHETGDEQYLEIIEKALRGYLVPVEYGGFLRYWDDEFWYEEYPTKNPSRVMNGFLFSLAGLYNLYENTGNELALKLFQEGVKTLANKIELYNADFISKYSLQHKEGFAGYAKKTYHKLHIWQLLWLYEVTDQRIFFDTAQRYLEIQKTQFAFIDDGITRVKQVKADNHIKDYTADNVYDGKWSYGLFWVTDTNSVLSIELGSLREVYGLCLYYNGNKSSGYEPEVFILKDGVEQRVTDLQVIKDVTHTSNKKRVTQIKTFNFSPLKGETVLLKFNGPSAKAPLSITEMDIFLKLERETELIHQEIIKRRNDDQKFSI
jgi:hypothetical protein